MWNVRSLLTAVGTWLLDGSPADEGFWDFPQPGPDEGADPAPAPRAAAHEVVPASTAAGLHRSPP